MLQLFGEEEFKDRMEDTVSVFLENTVEDGYFKSYDGARIHYSCAIHPKERAAVVISHGFCEFFAKYHEMTYYLYEMGYSVFFIDHRGHGFSHRDVAELDKVYIKSYDQYVNDFKCFLDQIVAQKSHTKQYLLLAHSMGGAIGTLFLECFPGYFKAAVLSAPMLSMNFQGMPDVLVGLLLIWSKLAGWGRHFVPKQHGYRGTYAFAKSSALSEPRYAYVYQYREREVRFRTCGGTYDWTKASIAATKELIRNAGKVQIPVLLFQAGRDTMVGEEGQNLFAERSGHTKLIRISGSKHEIFNGTPEIREKFYQEVFGFFEEYYKL